MNADEPPPAMGSVPTPADVIAYNAWAARTGNAPWRGRVRGQNLLGAPAGPAAPAPGRGRPGAAVPAPPAHGQVQPLVAGGFRRGTFWEGRTEYAVRANGERAPLRTWNSRAQTYRINQRNYDAYYSQNRQKFIVEVPCRAYVVSRGQVRAGQIPAAAEGINADGNAGDLPCVPQYSVGPDGQAAHRSAVTLWTPTGG